MEREIDRAAFLGWRDWTMSADQVPTFSHGDVTARIRWRPVGVAAWEVVVGEHGQCSLPVFRGAAAAKEDAWSWIAAEGVGP